MDAQAACRYLERYYDGAPMSLLAGEFGFERIEPEGFHYEPVVDVGRRAFREAVAGYIEENEGVLGKRLEAIIVQLQTGQTLS